MLRRFVRVIGLASAALLLAGVGSAVAQTTIRIPHCCAAGSHFDVGAKKFAELLEQKTGGKLKAAVFPGGQLGQETEVIQNVQTGTIEATFVGHDPLAQFAPVTTILSLPYLFRDHDQAFRLLEGRLGEAVEAQMREKRLRVLGWGYNGARVYTNSKRPVEKPDDLAGLKIRSPQSPVNLAVTRAFGGIPVAMPYGEVYTALQQGTIDGQENAVINIYPARLYEVQKFMSMTDHLLSFTVLIVNDRFFSSLPKDQQDAMTAAAKEAMDFQREHARALTNDLVAKMKERGVAVNTPDLEPFRKAARPIHAEYVGKSFGRDLYELVVGAR
ncbi:MAG TPA: TRAP transporter substrate-binding protein [Thermodesulfobacteriota bacterium]